MKSLISVLLFMLVFSFLNRAVFAQESAPSFRLATADPDSAPDYFYTLGPGRHTADRGIYPRPYSEGRVLKKGLLAPSATDGVRFASFLLLGNTGLLRLLPHEYGPANQTTREKSPSKIAGDGAYYSFGNLTHAYSYSDVQLDRNAVSVDCGVTWAGVGNYHSRAYGTHVIGFGSDPHPDSNLLSLVCAGDSYGMLTIIGDTPLEQITAEDPRAHFMATYKPAATARQAGVERRRFAPCMGTCNPVGGGLIIDGLHYRSSILLTGNSTYLMRSIVYDYSDVLIAFRVVGKDADGGVTLAWKLLQRYRAPALRR